MIIDFAHDLDFVIDQVIIFLLVVDIEYFANNADYQVKHDNL